MHTPDEIRVLKDKSDKASSEADSADKRRKVFTDKVYTEDGSAHNPDFWDGDKLKPKYQAEWDEIEADFKVKHQESSDASWAYYYAALGQK